MLPAGCVKFFFSFVCCLFTFFYFAKFIDFGENKIVFVDFFATLLYEIFATRLFRDFEVRILYLATLKFREFAKNVYCASL